LERNSIPTGDIRQQLEKILRSGPFAKSERMSRFLRFTVEQTLSGHSADLKEYLIGVEVFDRKPDYDSRVDPIVRVEARRLRSKLRKYYESEGRDDDLRIDFPTGSYVPQFSSAHKTESTPVTPVNENKTIAVLPFVELSPQPDHEYFADGLTMELIHALTKVEDLCVVAWNSMARWKDRPHDLKEIGGQLKADVVLEGSVRRSGDQVRIMAQLIDAPSGIYLWSETYSRQMRDILAIQEEIAHAIVDVLKLRLTPARTPAVIRQPDTEAYHLYLKGRYHWNKRTFEGLTTSVGLFEEAIAKDAQCAAAYAGLADAWSLMVEFGFLRTDEGMPRAKAAALRALELDNTLAEAHVSLAFILSVWDWQWRDAETHYLRALDLNPSYAGARHWYSIDFLALVGRLDEAEEQLHIGGRLDPLSFLYEESKGYLMMMRRDYEGAVRQYCRLQALAPEFHRAYTTMGRAYSFLGRYDDAINQLQKGLALAGEMPSIFAALGHIHGMAGRRAEALAMMERLIEMQARRSVSPTCFALVHLGLGEREAALDQLELACSKRQLPITVINVHPVYDPLRNEPRFQALIERVGFAQAAKAR